MNELMNAPVNPIQTALDQMVIIQNGRPYWSARQLLDFVGYDLSHWDRICKTGPMAKLFNDCQLSGYNTPCMLAQVGEHAMPTGGIEYREIQDFLLDKHQCNLLLINCDGRKKYVAAAHAYFSESAIELEALQLQNPNLQFRSPECYQQRDNVRSMDRMLGRDIMNCDNFNKQSFGLLKSKGFKAFTGSTIPEFKEQHGIPVNSPLNNHVDISIIMSQIQAFIMTHTYAVMNDITDINDLIQNYVTNNEDLRLLFKKNIGFWPEELPVMLSMEKEKRLLDDFRFMIENE